MNAILDIAPDAGKMGIGNVQVRINAKGDREKIAAVCLIAVKEIPIVKIPICPGICDGLSCLVYWIFVAFSEHQPASSLYSFGVSVPDVVFQNAAVQLCTALRRELCFQIQADSRSRRDSHDRLYAFPLSRSV